MAPSGYFISFEGIDGAGKSSHIASLVREIRAAGRTVTQTREPGGTPLAEGLREWLLKHPMDALTEALLMFAARRDHLMQVIEPALGRGEVVLCDRFTDATFAYQGYGRGFDLAVLNTLEGWVQTVPGARGLRQPDLTVWFDVPPSVAAQRLASARAPDKFEALPESFFQRVADGYAARAQASPQRYARIDGTRSMDQVWDQVRAVCAARGLLPGEAT